MKLADLRKASIKKNVRIRFRLPNGMECIVNRHGIAEVPELKGPPDFNLEDALAQSAEFRIEPAAAGKQKPAKVEILTRAQMEALLSAPAGAEAHAEEHED